MNNEKQDNAALQHSDTPDSSVQNSGAANDPDAPNQPEQAERDPYWTHLISPRTFHRVCAIMGGVFMAAGVVSWLLSSSALVGLVVIGCGGLLTFLGLSGLRDVRRSAIQTESNDTDVHKANESTTNTTDDK